jgi:enoyl-CoA hydratase/carnithine racemase
MMRLGSVEFEKRGAIALVTLDEPGKLNALSAGIREGVSASLARIEADPDIRVGIITGSGEKAFCAGADISGFDFSADAVKQFIEEIVTFLASPESCSKPLIAAVNGMAFGGGFELAIACDFILASERATFGVPEIKLGLLPGFAVVRLADIVGRPKAKEMSMLGDPVSADEAVRLGIALRAVAPERLMEEALAMAEKIASKPQMAVRMAKSFYNRGLGGDDLRAARDGFPFLFMTPDAREGVTAFREKRKPKFS